MNRLLPGLLTLLVAACAPAAGGHDGPPEAGPASSPTAKPAAGYGIYVVDRYKQPWRLAVIDTGNGQLERALPLGVTNGDWSRLYAVEEGSRKATLRVLEPSRGTVLRELQLDRTYSLPLSQIFTPTGLSPDGHWLTLQNERFEGELKRSYLVMDTNFAMPSKSVDPPGQMQFFAVSNDGSRLYLTEAIRQSNQVFRNRLRAYDLAAGRLDPQVVFDRSAEKQGMVGYWRSQVTSPDGRWLYSLYIEVNRTPVIFALDLTDGASYGVDLPWTIDRMGEEQFLWQLALSPDATRLYVVNGGLGLVAAVDPHQHRVLDSSTLDLPSQKRGIRLFTEAQAKRILAGAVALSIDGRTLFAPSVKGLLAIDTATLSLTGVYARELAFDSLAMSPDGAWLYGANFDRGTVLQVDPRSGAVAAEVPTSGWVPAGLLRVVMKR